MPRGRVTIVLLIAVAVVTVLPALPQVAAVAKKPYYCSSRSAPKGCITVPPEARRKRRISPRQRPTIEPPETVGGGGAGGGGGRREDGAIDWAGGFSGSSAWSYRDVRFVARAYAARELPRYASAHNLRRNVYLHTGPATSAPRGTLMLFRADRFNRGLGHVGLSQGNGTMLSALDLVRPTNVAKNPYWRAAYLGWARAPREWPGRLPVPFNLLGPIDEESAKIVSPGIDAVVRGPVTIEAQAPAGALVEFAVYYSDDPGRLAPTWHDLGVADTSGTQHVLEWNTALAGDQGDSQIGTVTIAAITVDTARNRQGVGDYRRVSVDNIP